MPARRRNPDSPPRVRLVGFDKQRALSPAVEAFIRDVFDASHPLPFQNAYRTQRVLAHIEAVVEVLPEHGGIKIETVRALSRRKGEGTKAMRFLTDLADKHGVELYLYAKPFGDEKMPLDDLVRFYRRFGFRQAEEADEEEDEYEDVEMHRWPRETLRSNPRRRNPSQTETPAFKKWFGRSKAVDAAGQPLVVYHGSPEATFTAFRATLTDQPMIMFSGSREVAETYTRKRRGSRPSVYAVYLRAENPLVVDVRGADWDNIPLTRTSTTRYQLRKHGIRGPTSVPALAYLARRLGYDGLVVENVVDVSSDNTEGVLNPLNTTYVVFDPTQVKSATNNRGTFDPADPSIYRNPRMRSRSRR